MSISGLVAEYIVASDVTRARFPADAPSSRALVGVLVAKCSSQDSPHTVAALHDRQHEHDRRCAWSYQFCQEISHALGKHVSSLESLRVTTGKPWEKPQETIRKKLENQGQSADKLGKLQENHGQTTGKYYKKRVEKSWKTTGRPWENERKIIRRA